MSLVKGLLMASFAVVLAAVPAYAGWSQGAPMEGARSQIRAVTVNGEIYVAGGSGILGPEDAFEVYDPVADHWHSLPSLPDGREQFGMAALGTSIIVAGGFSGWEKGKPTGEAWSFDTATSRWTRIASLPNPRTSLTLVAGAGRIFAIGGRGADAELVFAYDVAADKWSEFGKPMPVSRTGHAAALLGNRAYILGGRSASGELLARVDILNLDTGEWGQAAALPAAMSGLTADVIGGRLHAAGGVGAGQRKTLADHFMFDPAGGWKRQQAMPTPRHGLASAVAGGKWYLFGGGAGSGAYAVFTETDVVEIYAP